MVIVLFWSRMRDDLTPEVQALYQRTLARMRELAESSPGFVSHKTYTAVDGERVTIVAFDSRQSLAAWRDNTEHRAAQELGRSTFYRDYRVQVCAVDREYRFDGDAGKMRPLSPSAD